MGKESSDLGKVLAANLSRWMSLRELNDRKVERICGVGHKTVNNMRHGRHEPELDNIEKIASALGIPAWLLLVPGLDEAVFTEDDLRSLIQNYIAARPESRTAISGLARDAALAATHRKAS